MNTPSVTSQIKSLQQQILVQQMSEQIRKGKTIAVEYVTLDDRIRKFNIESIDVIGKGKDGFKSIICSVSDIDDGEEVKTRNLLVGSILKAKVNH